jgi:hypothetical protein
VSAYSRQEAGPRVETRAAATVNYNGPTHENFRIPIQARDAIAWLTIEHAANCMNSLSRLIVGASALVMSSVVSLGEIKIVVDYNANELATADFKFTNAPSPSRSDAATKARFAIVDGEQDANGGDVDTLHDGKVPTDEDEPSANFFFRAGTDGGRLLVDLGSAIDLKQVTTYSWHPDTRGPQVYKLYASDGNADGFNAQPKKGTQPEMCGWKRIANVDTRPKAGESGGQYAVSVSDSDGAIGTYRYLLFDISRTEQADAFGNTFYSEIDVIDRKAPAAPPAVAAPVAQPGRETVAADGGTYRITIDTCETPDLTEWAHKELAPVVQEWYPKIVKLLPSEGYQAPKHVSIRFSKDMRGVAATSGTRIRCAPGWVRRNLRGEAVGSVVHELVHVVQQYGRARRANPNATGAPGWLVEGIADYLRWFQYEPQSHGAEITQRNVSRARYDGNYRITANFLNWVAEKYDRRLVERLNAALREANYNENLWKKCTGHTVQELGDEWKKGLEERLGAEGAAADDQVRFECSIFAASTKSLSVNPSTLCVQRVIFTLPQARQMSGWWPCFSANSPTVLVKLRASRKSLNLNSFST